MTSMDEVMMRMSASVMATPVRPAMVVNMTMVGFCNDCYVQNPLDLTFVKLPSFTTQVPPTKGRHANDKS